MTRRAETDAPLGGPIRLVRPLRQTRPLVLASPHSGRRYPESFLALSRLPLVDLRASEDTHVDTLFEAGPDLGVPLLCALFPRVYVDVNRERLELDPSMFFDPLPANARTETPRVRAGLGTLSRVAGEGNHIYRRKLAFADAESRLRQCYDPYHAALAGLIGETRARFGYCVVLDCHSMPSSAVDGMGGRGGAPDMVLGDRHGGSCDSTVTDSAEAVLTDAGFRVRRNQPYAGGFTTSHYGRPGLGVHVLQLEINRALYINERTRDLTPGADRLRAVVPALVAVLGTLSGMPLAAE
ncbi:N-formylglutamate amidohydrolase [Roseospira marina]|uniref:N-formylglutamate amidohydrolase n=1 Tax=Roseospira marina TaxID=140057 RepID=A0A5M6IHC7_9PROT|nr:N-formylglutamate amidohydrolase [Roseospira marina]KAA5607634.1 N-formylglutamate amidohydrolase [Roseospira marina]MBB4312166.1 N-formylglutamate amidohydrolase [Roseospira marina]MBB5085818.1 N-formylglutamate amidohydrolase [Roseospira marina]